jgi:hypothetical protein
MKSRARQLLDKSISAMVAALEVYNKPSFAYREDNFAILAVNSMELLLKSRILQLDGNRISSILEYERRPKADGKSSEKRFRKKNRAGNYVTVSIFRAYDLLINEHGDSVNPAVRANLEALVEIRDNAIHFFNSDDLQLSVGVHEVGAATIKNYLGLVRQWFGVDLSRYRLFLMPLAFIGSPSRVEGISLNHEEKQLLNYLEALQSQRTDDVNNDFNVALTIDIRVRRSKDPAATPMIISNAPDAVKVTLEEENIREQYPWDYHILTAKLSKRYSNFKLNQDYHDIRSPLEKDLKYCHVRLLDPAKPNGLKKKLYNPNILAVFDQHYTRSKSSSAG